MENQGRMAMPERDWRSLPPWIRVALSGGRPARLSHQRKLASMSGEIV